MANTIVLTFILSAFSASCIGANHLFPGINGLSTTMMRDVMAEIDEWNFLDGYCELSALRGIKKLVDLNLSHPVKEGLSMVYFVPKSNTTTYLLFGQKQARWSYHCCIGFKDLYFGKDFLIDMAYHRLTGDDKRLIEKKEYMEQIPDDVNIFIIPCMILERFIELLKVRMPQLDLEEFLTKYHGPILLPSFRSTIDLLKDSDSVEMVQYMVNRSIIFRCTTLQTFRLPNGWSERALSLLSWFQKHVY